jgi:hypothetical protein
LTWGAAAVTAAALYAVPYSVLGALLGSPAWVGALVVDVAVLVVVALRRWSPLVVFGAALLSGVGFALAWAIAGGDGSTWLEVAGALLLALPIGAWGVRRGAAALPAILVGWLAAGIWIAVVERVS